MVAGTEQVFLYFVILISAFLIAFTFHEFTHAWVSYLLGDDTAKKAGRITLNPFAHIDPVGFLFLIFFRIGWGRPVPMNPQNFKYPKIYELIASLSGPISNFFLALVFLYAIKYTPTDSILLVFFFDMVVRLNVMLGIFNILPIPPLDGGHIVAIFVPKKYNQIFGLVQLVFIFSLFIAFFFFPQTQLAFLKAINYITSLLNRLVV